MQQIVLASDNLNKIKEFQEIFKSLNIEIIPKNDFNIPQIDEPYYTFIENALHKARHTSQYCNLPVLADDSGLCVKALNNKPGVLSARYAGSPTNASQNNQKLIQNLHNISDKTAYYYCLLVLIKNLKDPQPLIAEGRLNGIIIDKPKGANGFGYDPHMFLPQFGKTVAELKSEIKNQISHRAQAIKTLISLIAQYF